MEGKERCFSYVADKTTSIPSFAKSVERDAEETTEKKMVTRDPGGEKHVKEGPFSE